MEPGAYDGRWYRGANILRPHLGSHIKATLFLALLFLYNTLPPF